MANTRLVFQTLIFFLFVISVAAGDAVNLFHTKGTGAAVRLVESNQITIQVEPGEDTLVWGLEEYIPVGLTVSDISLPNGHWDEQNRKLSWWTFGEDSTTLKYQISGVAGTYTLAGSVIFNDTAASITGDTELVIAAEGESEGESSEGEGESVEGEGESVEGESAEGEGESVEGESTEGEGESVEGESTEGEGESVEGESTEGESVEGESTE